MPGADGRFVPFVVLAAVSMGAGCGHGVSKDCAEPPAAHEPRTVAAIVAAVEQTYRDCESYRDMGEVAVTRLKTTGSSTTSARFQTVFVRGRGFRFSYDPVRGASAARFTLASFGETAVELSPTRPRSPVDLRAKLRSMVGVSGGTSDLIASLLFAEPADDTPFDSRCHTRGEDVEVGGDSCFEIQCSTSDGKHTTNIAIRKRDMAVRMIDQYIDRSSGPKYQGSTDFSDPEAQRAYAANPLPLPDDLGMKQRVIFHPQINGPVGDVEIEIPEEDDVPDPSVRSQ